MKTQLVIVIKFFMNLYIRHVLSYKYIGTKLTCSSLFLVKEVCLNEGVI